MSMPHSTLFERLGGQEAVNAAVDLFYDKVLKDERINHFFGRLDMANQRAKQRALLTFAFGGPNHYSGKTLREGHAHLVLQGLNDTHFDAVLENLVGALKELGVSEDLIKEVATVADSTRDDVLGR